MEASLRVFSEKQADSETVYAALLGLGHALGTSSAYDPPRTCAPGCDTGYDGLGVELGSALPL